MESDILKVFRGEVKNLSELKIVLKQIGVE